MVSKLLLAIALTRVVHFILFADPEPAWQVARACARKEARMFASAPRRIQQGGPHSGFEAARTIARQP
ncbi:MAG: hypothetical protein J2P21_17775 [Chloracidobacterium sp.]|nr:hypothetical protein [Chloracidobacterium sp.]